MQRKFFISWQDAIVGASARLKIDKLAADNFSGIAAATLHIPSSSVHVLVVMDKSTEC
jgi:hypothetical protein